MKTLMLFCFAAFATTAVFVSRAQTDEVPSNAPLFLDASGFSDDAVELQPARDDLNALRGQYLDAARQRSELMDEEALRKAIAGEEKSVAELHAQRSLDQVEQQLLQITNEFTATAAGRRAAALLEQLTMLKQQAQHQGDRHLFGDPDPRAMFNHNNTRLPDPESDFFREPDAGLDRVPAPSRASDDFGSDDDPRPRKQPSIPNVVEPRNDGAFFNTPESDRNRNLSDPDDLDSFSDRF